MNNILYDETIFILDKKQAKNYPNVLNYKCKNFIKYEYKNKGFFWHAIVKRKKIAKTIIYDLTNKHSEECIKLMLNEVVNTTNIIKIFTEFISSSYQILDTKDTYNKYELIAELKDKYNDKKDEYNFKLKSNTISNIISRWKSQNLRFTK